jgi:hypothetical protein
MRSALFLLLMALVLFPLAARATIINIPDDYPTIQEGIDHSSDGDTVLVQPDTYYENLNFNGHNVVLASLFLTTGDTSYITGTTIDGSQSDRVVTFENGEERTAKLVGFTIQNGYAPNGGAILCDHSSPTISNNIIRNSTAHLYYGGGIYCLTSDAEIRHNTITSNSSDWGGAIYTGEESSPNIAENTITNNSASRSGGGIFFGTGTPAVSYNTISHNTAEVYGGGIQCWYSIATINDNTITDNSCVSYGGGISCDHSQPNITNNTISGNSSGAGGGIYCEYASATIVHNSILDNTAGQGGGIMCEYGSHAIISDNSICGNLAPGRSGGGILCSNSSNPSICGNTVDANSANTGGGICSTLESSPTIENNTVTNNSASGTSGQGGGIAVWGSYNYTTISGNLIDHNSASYGGGIVSYYSRPVVIQNTLSFNSAQVDGGAVYCVERAPEIDNNTITGNQAGANGGGICLLSSTPFITSNILWGDTASVGPEIYSHNTSPSVKYCDVQGGWTGLGNIDADPLFVDPQNGDFNLQSGSPCIDTGDPEAADPDHSRLDMGAFPYHFEVTVRVNPDDQFPLVFPPGYDAYGVRTIANNTDVAQPFRMVSAVTDTLGRVLQLLGGRRGELPPGSLREAHGYFHVADNAPDGFYFYVVRITNPETGELWHMSITPVEISGGKFVLAANRGWSDRFEGQSALSELPLTRSPEWTFGSHCYPNPFNAATTICYEVPTDSNVGLEVYNLCGQRVAMLVNAKQQAGNRSIVWDASGFSSGIYFYRLTAGDFTETKRMMLVK